MSRKGASLWNSTGLVLVLALATLVLGGCGGGPQLVNTWQDPEFKSPPFDDILVVGIGSNPGRVRIFESAFTDILVQQGVRAQPGYKLFPPDEKTPQEEIDAALVEHKIDALILTRVLGVDRQSTYTPGYTIATPGSSYYRDYYGLYDHSYAYYHSPGYTSSYDVAQLETSVFDVATGTMVWTGMSETVDPKDIEKEASKLAKIILKELTAGGLVHKN